MHIAAIIAYGLTVWFGMLLFSALAGEHFWKVLYCGPLIVSGAVALLLTLDGLVYYFLEREDRSAPTQEPAE